MGLERTCLELLLLYPSRASASRPQGMLVKIGLRQGADSKPCGKDSDYTLGEAVLVSYYVLPID